MTITTYESLIETLSGISFPIEHEGIDYTVTISDFPITNLTSAITPTGYIRLPLSTDAPITAEGGAMWPRFEIEVVILISPSKQNQSSSNFRLGVKVMDGLATALRTTQLAKTKSEFELRFSKEIMGSYDYWAVVAEIRCNG